METTLSHSLVRLGAEELLSIEGGRGRCVGTGANAIVTGRFCGRSLIGSAAVATGGVGVITLPDTAPAVGTGFDSTVNNLFDVFATWGTNNANSILVHQSWIWLLN